MKQKTNTFLSLLSELILWLWGWKVMGTLPKINKYVAIVAPHRAGVGDVLRGLLVKAIQNPPPVKFPAKIEIMRVPLVGHFLAWIGGIPVDRKHTEGGPAKGVVTQELLGTLLIEECAVVALAPEGTRKVGAPWRTGFYRIAVGAKVPLVMVAFDYKQKKIWISEPITLVGNYIIDLDTIEQWYQSVVPDYEPVV